MKTNQTRSKGTPFPLGLPVFCECGAELRLHSQGTRLSVACVLYPNHCDFHEPIWQWQAAFILKGLHGARLDAQCEAGDLRRVLAELDRYLASYEAVEFEALHGKPFDGDA